MAAAFAHPYGVVATGDTVRVSAQNGGAVVNLNMSSGAMEVAHVVSHKASVLRSGPLRGIALDARGCEHVADKRANTVLHYCPADGPLTGMTPVTAPVGLTVDPDTDLLYCGSLDKEAHVVALDLGGLRAGGGGAPLARRRVFTHPQLLHPAGLVVWDGTLFVLEQHSRALMAFDARNGRYLGERIHALPDVPEALLVSDC